MRLHVVLVEPEIPQNTGNVARTCAAVGADLHLVHPLGFRVDDAAVRRAGLDYWNLLTIHEYDSLTSFLGRHADSHLYLFSARGSVAHTAITYAAESYLIFGKETEGLPEELIRGGTGEVVRIPIREDARCLNLSNAVAVGVFEVLRQWGYPGQAAMKL
ncbi:MAG: tRNA (cytidine(34)-2'-O)-methyltransferase [Spirochaetales bacterium]|nr:tRNA (cytidine(34)-2'-O)-methyltransferase [Spirochaetales bacterium]